ncbi:uncharacterized protein LOC108112026 [Drosophila eugracilis]|uniref:uncharacterized protein LOC108112026 n=1 Tax=Drosophila eugracilis TaxID=29029 RepID=UPI0007E72461|nr:uncharacterized protein LOC108112026 [Drosophila eugracilis]
METKTTEPQDEELQAHEQQETTDVDDLLERLSGESEHSTTLAPDVKSIISQDSGRMVEIIRKNERKLLLREVLDRLKEREEQDNDQKSVAKSEDKKKKSTSFSSKRSRLEQKEEGEIWTKLDDEIADDATPRHSDLSTFAAALLVDEPGEDEELPTPMESSSESEPDTVITQRSKSIDPMQLAVKSLMLVPSLSEISLSSEPDVQRKSGKSIKSVKSSGFRDPLGDDAGSSFSEEAQEESSQAGNDSKVFKVGDQLEDSDSLHDSSIVSIPEVREPKTAEKKVEDYMDFESMFVVKEERTISINTDSEDDLRFLETQEIVRDFINNLVKKVIASERPGSSDFIRKRLDKEKLLAALQKHVHDYVLIKDMNNQLEDRMVDYFRRLKNFRAFDTLAQADQVTYRNRHEQALAYLAYGQERLEMVKNKYGTLMSSALMDLSHAMHIVISTEEHLEQTIRRLLVRPDAETDFMKRFVSRELRLMSEHRNKISDTRLILISRKHTLGLITDHIADVETVCDGVSMKDFITVQAKMFGLEKKLEERNNELKRQRLQYHTDLHLTKHAREKSLEIKEKITDLKEDLLTKTIVRNKLKTELCNGKVEHKRIRAKIRDLTYRGGILAMPALMYDYDRTVSYIREKEGNVSNLRDTFRSITNQLQKIEVQ